MTSLSSTALARLRQLVEGEPAESRYEIIETIGEGGMSTVYLAHDRELERDVALKVLRDAAPISEERSRIQREAQILASLEHPGIVPVHDVGVLPDGSLFYVMKRVKGEQFDEYVRGGRPRSELLRALLQVCDAVSFAHAAGVVHRDLKPQNVMIGAFGEVLVLDWGVATWRKDVDASTQESEPTAATGRGGTAAAGTPGYMAPEQLDGAADERSDVFGLGGILYFLLTRQHPSASTDVEVSWPSHGSVPTALRAIVERSRRADPSRRYPTVPAFAADVVNYLDALPVVAHRESILERTRRLAVRHRPAVLLVLAYLVMRVALLIFIRR